MPDCSTGPPQLQLRHVSTHTKHKTITGHLLKTKKKTKFHCGAKSPDTAEGKNPVGKSALAFALIMLMPSKLVEVCPQAAVSWEATHPPHSDMEQYRMERVGEATKHSHYGMA